MLIIRDVRLFVRLFGRLLLCSSESEFLGCNCNKHDYLHIRGILRRDHFRIINCNLQVQTNHFHKEIIN